MQVSAKFMRLGWLVLLGCLLAGCRVDVIAGSIRRYGEVARHLENGLLYLRRRAASGPIWSGSVDGDHYTIRLNGQSECGPLRDQARRGRKRIDVFHHETPPGTYGGSLKGIYDISGDSLTVCYDLTGQRYPESFNANRGSRQVLTDSGASERLRRLTLTKGGPRLDRLITGRTEDYGNSGRRLS